MKKLTKEEFIKRAREIHGNKYDYSKVEYINNSTKVCIICPEHGEFWQTPNNHLNKKGCCICGGSSKLTKEEFIKRARDVHGNKYDYSKVEYKGMHTKVCIICPEHGEFWQTPANHVHWKQKCPTCTNNKKLTTEEFIKRAREVHGNKYDYSKVKYINNYTKVCIICPEHGEFWQTPHHHITNKCECPICNISRLENEVKKLLNKKEIIYKWQVKRNIFEWLHQQSLDFYLPDYNIVIECQGEQHFVPIDYFGGINRFVDTIERDRKKKNLVINNGNKIIYIIEKRFEKNIKSNILLEEIYSNVPIVWVEIDKNGNLKNDDKQKLIETILNL